MEPIIDKLKKSPLFNLSLSSKELFHSNFLYWLAKNYHEEFGNEFKEYLKLDADDKDIKIKEKSIAREEKKIDLSFKYSNGKQIIIENKIKSLPNKAQLLEYSKDKNVDKHFILLSLAKPSFSLKDWAHLSYEGLIKKLENIYNNIQDIYHKQVLADYIEFVDCLVKIEEQVGKPLLDDDAFNFYSTEVYKLLGSIRFHDFYLKRKHELLGAFIQNRLIELLDEKQSKMWESKEEKVYISSGMTRASGLTDINFSIGDKNLLMGVQIQGNSYRMTIQDKVGKDPLADKIKEVVYQSFWFKFHEDFPNQKVFPRDSSSFNHFGKHFFYKSVLIDEKMKIGRLADVVVKHMYLIKDNLKEIYKYV